MPIVRVRVNGVTSEGRHPGIQAITRYFDYGHLSDELQAISMPFARLAQELLEKVGDSPELTACLRKLLEAKDCAVRAALQPEE